MELQLKWLKGNPSHVYQEYEKATGEKVKRLMADWKFGSGATLLFASILGLAYMAKERTRLKAWEYTGWSSIKYLANLVSGKVPALELPSGVAELVAGFVTDDDYMMKRGWSKLNPSKLMGIIGQIDGLVNGEKDWLDMLLYLKGKDFMINELEGQWKEDFDKYYEFEGDRYELRKKNPLLDARLFITGKVSRLQSDKARKIALEFIKKHELPTDYIEGYDAVFGVDTKAALEPTQSNIGQTIDDQLFTTNDFASEVNKLEKTVGLDKLYKDNMALAVEYLKAKDLWQPYFEQPTSEGRHLYRERFADIEANLFFWGHLTVLENPDSGKILLGLMDKYNIPPEGIRAFAENMDKYDDLVKENPTDWRLLRHLRKRAEE